MIIDININYGHWPGNNWEIKSLNNFLREIKKTGINKGLVSSIDGIFSFDPEIYNRKIIKELKNSADFKILPVINPKAKNWKETIKDYMENKIKIFKIVPSFHRYSLIEDDIYKFFEIAEKENIIIVIQKRFEDERTKHPILNIKDFGIENIEKVAKDFPDLKIIVLCLYMNEAIKLVENCKNLYTDISFIEHLDTLSYALKYILEDRILFGSHTPFLYPESALFKLKYSNISKTQFEKISGKNFLSLVKDF